MTLHPPTTSDTVAALTFIGRLLDVPCAYQCDGRFFFPLTDGWALVLEPDDAGRFRILAWHGASEIARLWVRTGDWRRLADLALSLQSQVAALRA